MNNTAIHFTQEQREFIFKNYKGITTYELANKFNQFFHTNFRRKKFRNFMINRHLCNNVDTTFKKDKGHPNYKPIGYEREYNHGGYDEIMVKIDNCKYDTKRRVIYEKYYGEIPKDCIITFLDGNRKNYDINNLIAIPKTIHFTMSMNNYYFNNKKLTELGLLIANLKCKIRRANENSM